MKIYAITTCFADPEMIEKCIAQTWKTSGLQRHELANWIWVNDHWPLRTELHASKLHEIADRYSAPLITTPTNLGAHGAWNFALKHIPLEPDDLVLNIDQDSWPITENWGRALLDVMIAEPSWGYLSLLDERCIKNRNWKFQEIAGHKIATDPYPEMYNVTLYRGKTLIPHGMLANGPYYGGVEAAMWGLNFDNGFLYDFREDRCPIQHPQVYIDWKLLAGAGKTNESFIDYVRNQK